MKKDILGIKVDDITMEQALNRVEEWLSKGGKHYITTINPEFVVAAQEDSLFKKILNDADLSIPDGAGLKLSGRVKNVTAGTDLMDRLVEKAAKLGATVGFLGGRDDVAEKCAECLKKKYPGLKVVFAESGGEVDYSGMLLGVLPARDPAVHPRSTSLAAATRREALLAVTPRNTDSDFTPSLPRTDLLFVAFGHIKQEKWIAKNLPHIPIKVAMGVGGAFDYLSGKVKRAPKWLRQMGLEWLFRAVVQPWRIRRQLALIKYVWLLVTKNN